MAGIDPEVLTRLTRGAPLLGLIDAAGLRRLARHGRLEHFAAGAAVVRQGEEGGTFYLVAGGSLAVRVATHDGEREVARLGPGACFGEIAVLTRQPRSASVVALEPCELACFWRAPVLQTLRDFPAARAYLDRLGIARSAASREAGAAPAAAAAVPLLRAPNLAALPGVVHGFTGRAGGVSEGATATLDLAAGAATRPEEVAENRRRVAAALGVPADAWTHMAQVHGAEVVAAPSAGAPPARADGLWTAAPGRLLVALTADCLPILLADADGGPVAAVHAGWRGTAAGIAAAAVRALVAAGAAPARLQVALGPAIGPCCFAIDPATAAALQATAPGCGAAVQRRDAGLYGDLWEINAHALRQAGVPAAHIVRVGGCTACDPGYYSHRRDAGRTGRQAGVIARR